MHTIETQSSQGSLEGHRAPWRALRLALYLSVLLVFVLFGLLPGGACTEADTRILIRSCPSGEIETLEVLVLSQQDAIKGACPSTLPKPSFTLQRPCDTSTQFQLPNLAEGEQLLFFFRRTSGRASYCETCEEGSRSNAVGSCKLEGPSACRSKESCGNGKDDNCNGQVDEGCETPDTTPDKTPEPPRDQQEPSLDEFASDEPVAEPPVDRVDAGPQEPIVEQRDAGPVDVPSELIPGPDRRADSIAEPACDGGCGEVPGERVGEPAPDNRPKDVVQGCKTSADCGGNPCIDSRCSTSSALCSNDDGCGLTERCIKGGCHKVASLCAVDSDCPTGQRCVASICQICDSTGQNCKLPTQCDPALKGSCPTGFSCAGRYCLKQCQAGATPRGTCPDLPRMSCRTNPGHTSGLCALRCQRTGDCPQRHLCSLDPATAIGYCLRL